MKDMKQILFIIAAVLIVTALSFAAVADENEIVSIDYLQFDGAISVPDRVTDIEYGGDDDDPTPVSPPPSVKPIESPKPTETTQPDAVSGRQAADLLQKGYLMDCITMLKRLVGLV